MARKWQTQLVRIQDPGSSHYAGHSTLFQPPEAKSPEHLLHLLQNVQNSSVESFLVSISGDSKV